MPERVVALSEQVSSIATGRVEEIRRVTKLTTILGVNASIEAARSNNAGFAVVAEEVRKVSEQIESLADALHRELGAKTSELQVLGQKLVADIRGSRLADLSLGMIDIIDRNLYERSCDVRWWATDSAMVACAGDPDEANRAFASSRLGVILDSYTVYLDLWVSDLSGRVLANGRPRQYAVQGSDVSQQEWFQRGRRRSRARSLWPVTWRRSRPLAAQRWPPIQRQFASKAERGDVPWGCWEFSSIGPNNRKWWSIQCV
ncbi:MAG: methyl-accepting chemotaxis protein [Acidobacteriota bacterium]